MLKRSQITTPDRPVSKRTGKPARRTKDQERFPWDDIRRAYIEGIPVVGTKDEFLWPNLRELSEEFEVPYTRVRKRAADERWRESKEQREIIASRERARKRAAQIEKNALDFDEKSYTVAQLGMAMVTTRLGEIAKEVNVKKAMRDDALERLERGEPVAKEELYSAIRYNELEGLASAASRFQELGQKALGTNVERLDVTGASTVNVVNVRNEIQRDDPDRLGEMVGVMVEAGLIPDVLQDKRPKAIAGAVVDVEAVPESDVPPLPNDMTNN